MPSRSRIGARWISSKSRVVNRHSLGRCRFTSRDSHCFFRISCFPNPLQYGSSKTQNIQNAVTHAESSEPLAWRTIEQVSPVRKHHPVAHRLPIVRLLPRATGVDARRQIRLHIVKAAATSRFNASTFFIFILHSGTKLRKVSH